MATRRASRRQFGSIRKLESGRYQARYKDRGGFEHRAPTTFSSKAEANAWLAGVQADLERGEWIDPRRGRETFAWWAQEWTASNVNLAPRTRINYESALRHHVLPFFGQAAIAELEQRHVQQFVSAMTARGAAAGTVHKAYRIAKSVLDTAVGSGALKTNPAMGVKLPRAQRTEKVFLTALQVEALAEAITHPTWTDQTFPEHGLLVRFAAYTGLRAAEIVGLRAGRIDPLRGHVHVVETIVPFQGGVLLERQPTKTRQRRTVVVPRFLVDQLVDHLGSRLADPDALVFTDPDGKSPLRQNAWYRSHFERAVKTAGLHPPPRFHDLRHTCVALLVQQGAHARAIMEQLGHSSITVTMDTYGHVFPSTLEELATGLDQTYRTATSQPPATAEVHSIDETGIAGMS